MCMIEKIIQKAEEYKNKHWSDNVTEMSNQRSFQQVKGVPHFYDNAIKQAYIAGATENGTQWHDLEKDPNDLPKGHKVVLNQVGAPTTYDPDRGFLGFGGCGIRAWTDVPLFKE